MKMQTPLFGLMPLLIFPCGFKSLDNFRHISARNTFFSPSRPGSYFINWLVTVSSCIGSPKTEGPFHGLPTDHQFANSPSCGGFHSPALRVTDSMGAHETLPRSRLKICPILRPRRPNFRRRTRGARGASVIQNT